VIPPPLSATHIMTPSRSYGSDLTQSILRSSLAAMESMAFVENSLTVAREERSAR
jgi:hypothetical protein